MKKVIKLAAITMAMVMMFSISACSDKGAGKTSSTKRTTETEEETEKPETEETTTETSASKGEYGELFNLMKDVIGKDQETAEKMIGEFFGTELDDRTGTWMTETRNNIETHLHVYSAYFKKDNIQFNELEIWTDVNDGHVRCLEFTLVNEAYNAYKIENTPEFRDEIKVQYEGIRDGLVSSYGDPFESGTPKYESDIYFAVHNIELNRFAYVELRDFTYEGGNGLFKMSVSFADVKEYLG